MDERARAYWQKFLLETGRAESLEPYECFSFADSEESADALAELVLSGKKRATSGSVDGCRLSGQRPPRPGDLSLVTDWAGTPRCVIETETVAVLPFDEITFERAALEGEDEHIESWRKNHRGFFSREGERLGYAFHEKLPVAFETFRVVYPA